MITFVSRCKRSWILRGILLALVIILPLLLLIGSALADRGRWTPRANWAQGAIERYAVHMLMLRGDNNPYHSRVLWFQGEDPFPSAATPTFEGGEWLWRPVGDTCTCATYPIVEFDSLGVDSTFMNPFCSGHASLGGGAQALT